MATAKTVLVFVLLCASLTPLLSQIVDVGEPLLLSPYIELGQIDAGQAAAKVIGLNSVIESYSGFITTNSEYNSNLFFWFFPARYNSENAPLLVWLNGGPGSSSMFGLFSENGPFSVDSHYRLNVRDINWATEFSVIYVDQPAGTGWSFTENSSGYARNQTDVGDAFYEFLMQWFQLFPQYQANEFYITGESFAGHYIPAISYQIYIRNPTADLKINFKGFAIGDGWIDPINQLNYGDFLYYAGLIGQSELQVFYKIQDEMASLINNGHYAAASRLLQTYGWRSRSYDEKRNFGNYMYECTGIANVYNYLDSLGPTDLNYYQTFLEFPNVRKAIHVGNLTFNDENNVVFGYLFADITVSVAPWFEALLNSSLYKIMLYNGQVDIICAHSLTTNMITYLDWYGAEDFAAAPRNVWRVHDVQVAGYSITAHNFTQIIIRDAGHYVPYDQPLWASDMISRFVNDIEF